jgi:hypothetical protein
MVHRKGRDIRHIHVMSRMFTHLLHPMLVMGGPSGVFAGRATRPSSTCSIYIFTRTR